eukprot:8968-Alexandrium_andersonii.AAC.1
MPPAACAPAGAGGGLAPRRSGTARARRGRRKRAEGRLIARLVSATGAAMRSRAPVPGLLSALHT